MHTPSFGLTIPSTRALKAAAASYDAATDAPLEALVDVVCGQGFLTLEQLQTVSTWKSPRPKAHVAKNDDGMVREATRVALQADSEQLRIGVLTLIAGVSVPTASVILHWFHPDPYPILDIRALASLGVAQPAWYSFALWRSYVDECRRLAREHDVTMRELDRALWQWSKEGRA